MAHAPMSHQLESLGMRRVAPLPPPGRPSAFIALAMAAAAGFLSVTPVRAQQASAVRAAVVHARPALERSVETFVSKRSCVSCHHNSVALLTFAALDRHGLAVNARVRAALEAKTLFELRRASAFDDAVQGANLGDPTPNDSYLLMACPRRRHGARRDAGDPRPAHQPVAARRALDDVGFPPATLEQPLHRHRDRGAGHPPLHAAVVDARARCHSRPRHGMAGGHGAGLDGGCVVPGDGPGVGRHAGGGAGRRGCRPARTAAPIRRLAATPWLSRRCVFHGRGADGHARGGRPHVGRRMATRHPLPAHHTGRRRHLANAHADAVAGHGQPTVLHDGISLWQGRGLVVHRQLLGRDGAGVGLAGRGAEVCASLARVRGPPALVGPGRGHRFGGRSPDRARCGPRPQQRDGRRHHVADDGGARCRQGAAAVESGRGPGHPQSLRRGRPDRGERLRRERRGRTPAARHGCAGRAATRRARPPRAARVCGDGGRRGHGGAAAVPRRTRVRRGRVRGGHVRADSGRPAAHRRQGRHQRRGQLGDQPGALGHHHEPPGGHSAAGGGWPVGGCRGRTRLHAADVRGVDRLRRDGSAAGPAGRRRGHGRDERRWTDGAGSGAPARAPPDGGGARTLAWREGPNGGCGARRQTFSESLRLDSPSQDLARNGNRSRAGTCGHTGSARQSSATTADTT